ncbi:MAG: hypothetical protein KF810_15925 [Rhizobiaceae bacterium]|nr:hypothetical protein [Rhizobiaceae bacterium]
MTQHAGGAGRQRYGATAIFTAMRGDVKSVEEVLAQHEDVIKRIRDAYGVAGSAARDYARESAEVIRAAAFGSVEQTEKKLREEVSKVREIYSGFFRNPFDNSPAVGIAGAEPFLAVFARIEEEAAKARPSITGIREEIARIRNETESGAVKRFANNLLEATDKADKLERAIPRARAMAGPVWRCRRMCSIAAIRSADRR